MIRFYKEYCPKGVDLQKQYKEAKEAPEGYAPFLEAIKTYGKDKPKAKK
jgi:hypothetical protein